MVAVMEGSIIGLATVSQRWTVDLKREFRVIVWVVAIEEDLKRQVDLTKVLGPC